MEAAPLAEASRAFEAQGVEVLARQIDVVQKIALTCEQPWVLEPTHGLSDSELCHPFLLECCLCEETCE
mgnify:CR=1 FL=1